jgi:hypothetical protein
MMESFLCGVLPQGELYRQGWNVATSRPVIIMPKREPGQLSAKPLAELKLATSLVLSLRGLLVLPGFMMPNGAACGRSEQAVMSRHMAGGTTDHSTFDATFRFSRNHRHDDSHGESHTA